MPTGVGTGSAEESGGATSGDSSTSAGGSSGGTTTGAAARVPIFVAQGNIGRTTISCDDGRTWVADRAWDSEADPLLCGSNEPVRCWESACSYLSGRECVTSSPECDCGHHPGFAKGIAFGSGAFVATWGWGYSGSVRRSTDGVHWEETLADDVLFGGLAFGGGRFVLSNRFPQYSEDGLTWTPGSEADFRGPGGEIVWSVRRFAYSDFDGGRFVASASPPQDVLVTSDGGQTWWEPSAIDDACLADVATYGGIASGDGVIVGVGANGTACRSTDGGDTWTLGSVGGDNVLGHLLWTGSQFVTWGPGVRYDSPDGVDWTATATTPDGIWIGPAAHNPQTGTFVANRRVWSAYEELELVRSANGTDWEPADAYERSHPIFEIAWGLAEPSDACPL